MSGGPPLQVLVVEEDARLATSLRDLARLARPDARVILASTAEGAMAFIAAPPAGDGARLLVVSAFDLGAGPTGHAVAVALREQAPEARLVLIAPEGPARLSGVLPLVDAHLGKPFAPARFVAVVAALAEALDRAQAQARAPVPAQASEPSAPRN